LASGLSAELLQHELRTSLFGRAARVLQETDSTIDLAREWVREGGPEGGVVIAARQRKGRGRLGRQWLSPMGGLWMSVIARPPLQIAAAGRLGVGMAVAGAEGAREATDAAVGLKWPNDLVIGEKKVGGVLVETEVVGDRIAAAVLSLGLNVNIPSAAFGGGVRDTAISLLAATGREHSIAAVAARILERLEALWPSMMESGTELRQRWGKLDALCGHELEVAVGDQMVQCLAMGIGLGGELALVVNGEARLVTAGEVRSVRRRLR